MEQEQKEEYAKRAIQSKVLGPSLIILGILFFLLYSDTFLLFVSIPIFLIGVAIVGIKIALKFKK